MLLTLLQAHAYDFKVDGIYYNLVSLPELTCEVASGDEKYEGDITIPSEVVYNGRTLSVIGIGNWAFKDCDKLTSIKASTIASIGIGAFDDCSILAKAEFPKVTDIGSNAFASCSSLKSVEFTAVTNLGYKALSYCVSLASIEMPALKVVSGPSFVGCTSLASVKLPSATTIGSSAFSRCKALVSLELPQVTSLDRSAFDGCEALVAVELPNVIEVGYYAFNGCSALQSVELPKAKECGGSAFENCRSLEMVELPQATFVGSSAFNGCSSLTTVRLPLVEELGNEAFMGCVKLKSVELGNTLKELNYGTFYGCASLPRLTIPGSVEWMIYSGGRGSYLFDSCTSLSELIVKHGTDELKLKDDHSEIIWGWGYGKDKENLPIKKYSVDRLLSNDVSLPYLETLELGEHLDKVQVVPKDSPNLKTIICHSLVPPAAATFTNAQYINVEVFVPYEAIDAYRNHEVWKNFWSLKQMSSVDEPSVADDEVVEVGRFDLNGRPVAEDYEGLAVVRYSDGSVCKVIGRK